MATVGASPFDVAYFGDEGAPQIVNLPWWCRGPFALLSPDSCASIATKQATDYAEKRLKDTLAAEGAAAAAVLKAKFDAEAAAMRAEFETGAARMKRLFLLGGAGLIAFSLGTAFFAARRAA